jgi:AcrR family transcriptional regulator
MIERGEGDRLTMRRLADQLGIQAPSLYKHFPDKESITAAVHAEYLTEQLAALEDALAADSDEHPLVRLMSAYRRFAIEHRDLFHFVFLLPYPVDLVADVLKGLRRTWMRAAGDSDLAVSAYAMARGMTEMEIHSLFPLRRMPSDADNHGVQALVRRAEARAPR